MVKILSIFVAFLENMNFNKDNFLAQLSIQLQSATNRSLLLTTKWTFSTPTEYEYSLFGPLSLNACLIKHSHQGPLTSLINIIQCFQYVVESVSCYHNTNTLVCQISHTECLLFLGCTSLAGKGSLMTLLKFSLSIALGYLPGQPNRVCSHQAIFLLKMHSFYDEILSNKIVNGDYEFVYFVEITNQENKRSCFFSDQKRA